VLRLSDPDFCGQSSSLLVAFDPLHDFTVLPWVAEGHLARPFGAGDVIVGCRHPYEPGQDLVLGGVQLHVWGKLACSGVGPHEQGLFVAFASLPTMARALAPGQEPLDAPSILILRLSGGFTPESVRFSLGRLHSVRVVEGGAVMTGVRQSVVGLLAGIVALCLGMLAVICLMVGVVFSAVVGERRAELGVLLAVGLAPWRLATLLALEAGMATGLGGLLGCLGAWLLARLARHTLLAQLASAGVTVVWPAPAVLAGMSLGTLGLALLVGAAGAVWPAWRLGRRDPYELLRGEA
jgi:putative ABC transport system permease protein